MNRGALDPAGMLALALAITVSACAEHPQRLDAEGDPCRSAISFCIDDDSEMRCVEDRWSPLTCAQACDQLTAGLETLGCESTSAHEGACACAPPPGGCTPGESSCADEQTLVFCGQDWQWSMSSCESLCADQPTHTISLGCVSDEDGLAAACACTAIGTACSDEGSVCVDDLTLASCIAGVWEQRSCTDLCGGPARCEPMLGTDADCACE